MANEQNLIPASAPNGYKLSAEEQSKGGKASVEARRRKKSLKELVEMFANLPPSDPALIDRLKQEGIAEEEITRGALIARNIVIGAVNQDHKAVAEYMDVTGQRIIRNVNENHNIEYKPLVDLTIRKKNQEDKKNGKK